MNYQLLSQKSRSPAKVCENEKKKKAGDNANNFKSQSRENGQKE